MHKTVKLPNKALKIQIPSSLPKIALQREGSSGGSWKRRNEQTMTMESKPTGLTKKTDGYKETCSSNLL